MIPDGIVDSLWYDVVERCEEFGDSFDPWQDGLGEVTLGLRADGTFAATVGGITYSIPRQVAKTFLVGRICVALCTLFPNLTILWSAHRTRTTTRTFQSLKGVVTRPSVRGYLRAGSNNGTAIRDANGEQEIPFANGSTILFGAREQGFGRGFDEVDVEVFDEAQILTVKALEDMVAATNQSRFVHGALLFYMGTPPRPTDPGEVFEERRADALRSKVAAGGSDFGHPVQHGDALYVECSADANVGKAGGPSLDDQRQVEKANPSYPHRTPAVAVKRLRKNLPFDDAWRREGLGVWDATTASKWQVLDEQAWSDIGVTDPPAVGRVSYGVKFSMDGSSVALAVALRDADGPVHVELVDVQPMSAGTAWLVDWLVESWRDAAAIVIDGKSGAGSLVNDLRERGVRASALTTPSVDQVITAHAGLLNAIASGTVTRFDDDGQSALTAAAAGAGKRSIGTAGGWGWKPTGEADVTPLEAVTMAHFGAAGMKARKVRTGEAMFQ